MEPVIQLIAADVPRARVATPTAVLKDVDWAIQPQEFWAVGALPGTGKTDLLCTAAGLQRPIKGAQLLFGKRTSEMSEEELVEARLRVAMVFDSGRLFNGMTVAQNVALPLSYHCSLSASEQAERVEEVLQATELSASENKRPEQLTRNMHQRIGLARALALRPEVVMVDNPLTGVDPRQGRWWLDFLCKLNQTTTVIITTDDLRPWTDVAQRFAVIRGHHLEFVGGRDEIKANQDELVRGLLTPAF